MGAAEHSGFDVYKGLQRPLVFRSLKGKFIYWGLACVLLGFLAAVLLSVLLSFFAGLVALLLISLGGLGYTAMQQKKGLHHKARARGVYLVPARWGSCRAGLYH